MEAKMIKPYGMGGSNKITRKSGSGSAGVDFLFYFFPDTNGACYVVVIRPENYTSYTSIRITISGSNEGYLDVPADCNYGYFARFRFTGLSTGSTYTIRMSYYSGSTEKGYTDIKRTYYGSKVTPSSNPYTDTYGMITVPSYSASYPEYCVDIACAENSYNVDGRCPYDADTRNLFWRVCATNYETHHIASAMEYQPTCRWHRGTVYVSVTYQSTLNQDAISARINEWISWMNGLMAQTDSGVTFRLGKTTATNGMQINVIVGTHQQLFGWNPDNTAEGDETYVYGGTWYTYWWGQGILESQVKICCESRYPFNYTAPDRPLFQGIVFEELTEASGPRYDQFALNNTVFSEIAYPSKSIGGPEGESKARDEGVIKILYSLGYLKGYTIKENGETVSYPSEFGSGIRFNQGYSSYGPLSSGSVDLFFQINASAGSITENGELPDTMYPTFKSKRTYTMRTIYATEIPETNKEQSSGLSFRYTNPSAAGYPYFDLPNKPSYSSTVRVDGGYRVYVNGLSVSREYYYVYAYLKDVTDADIDDYSYYELASASYNSTYVSITGLKYGRAYDFYLHSYYSGAESDWVHIGEGTVAPKKPTVSNVSNTDTSVTFTYNMDGTEFDYVMALVYRDGTLVATNNYTASSGTATLTFDKADGNYELRVYSVKNANGTALQCVDSSGNNDYYSYTFKISNRTYFYWADYTDQVKSGGVITSISHTVWNAFVKNIEDVVLANKSGYMPTNSSTYASGFGSAGNGSTSFATALNTYAKMSANSRTLTAERFNIVNYIINLAKTTGLSYKYNKDTSPTKVYASDLITLQNKLNSI